MRPYKIFLAISICLSLISCSQDISIGKKEFEKEITLSGINIETGTLTNIRELCIKDSFLITLNDRPDSIIQIYKIPSFELFYSFGKKGKGPGEYLFPRLVFNFDDNKIIAIHDPGNQSLWSIKVNETAEVVNKRELKFPDQIPISRFLIENRFFIYDAFTPTEGEIKTFDLETNKSSTVYSFNEFKQRHKTSAAYEGYLGVNPKSRLLVFMYMYYDRVDILNLKGKLLHSIVNVKSEKPQQKTDATSMVYYFGGYFTEDYIYGIYLNAPRQRIIEDSGNLNCFIEVFSWEGEPVKRFKLDRMVYLIAVDEANKVIYAKDPLNEDELCKYSLPDG